MKDILAGILNIIKSGFIVLGIQIKKLAAKIFPPKPSPHHHSQHQEIEHD
jgi:hypothetical protein